MEAHEVPLPDDSDDEQCEDPWTTMDPWSAAASEGARSKPSQAPVVVKAPPSAPSITNLVVKAPPASRPPAKVASAVIDNGDSVGEASRGVSDTRQTNGFSTAAQRMLARAGAGGTGTRRTRAPQDSSAPSRLRPLSEETTSQATSQSQHTSATKVPSSPPADKAAAEQLKDFLTQDADLFERRVDLLRRCVGREMSGVLVRAEDVEEATSLARRQLGIQAPVTADVNGRAAPAEASARSNSDNQTSTWQNQSGNDWRSAWQAQGWTQETSWTSQSWWDSNQSNWSSWWESANEDPNHRASATDTKDEAWEAWAVASATDVPRETRREDIAPVGTHGFVSQFPSPYTSEVCRATAAPPRTVNAAGADDKYSADPPARGVGVPGPELNVDKSALIDRCLSYLRQHGDVEKAKKVLLHAGSGMDPSVAQEAIQRLELELFRSFQ